MNNGNLVSRSAIRTDSCSGMVVRGRVGPQVVPKLEESGNSRLDLEQRNEHSDGAKES
jgi:hypothetical protein